MASPAPSALYRIALLLNLVVILPLGYWVRFSQGPLPEWANDGLGSVAYEIFWILLAGLLFPKISSQRIAAAVCLATCGIEFLQLWQPPFLQAVRATLPGRLILGNTFNWFDFLPYFLGSFVGWIWLKWLQRNYRGDRPSLG